MPPPGGKNKAAEERFANFMTSTAGGTQGSSSYGVNTPSTGTDTSSPNYPGGSVVDQAIQNFQNQQQIQEDFEKEREGKDPSPLVQAELKKREEKTPKNKFIQEILNLGSDIASMGGVIGMSIQGGAKGLEALLQKLLRTKPTAELLNDPKTLAVLNREFAKDPTGNFKKVFEEKYADIIKEAYEDNPTKQVRELSDSDFFDEQLQENAFASEQGILGAGSQRINFPAEFYTGEKGLNPYGAGGMPQTSGDLANLAGLAVTPEMQGNNPELVKMIFNARMELDRMGKNPMTGESQGQGGQGITSIPSSNFIGFTPDNMNAAKYPKGYGAFLLNPPAPVRPGSPTIQGFPDQDGDGVDDRYQAGPGIPRPGIDSVGPLEAIKPKTNLPAAFNYASMAPQFTGSQYTNQGVSPAFLENLRRFYG